MKKTKAKVKLKIVNPTTVDAQSDKVIEKQKIGKLELDFGREDLNKLVSKLNEVIDAI